MEEEEEEDEEKLLFLNTQRRWKRNQCGNS